MGGANIAVADIALLLEMCNWRIINMEPRLYEIDSRKVPLKFVVYWYHKFSGARQDVCVCDDFQHAVRIKHLLEKYDLYDTTKVD